MTLYDRRKKKLIDELKNKEYRDAFVEENINLGIPFQIKALREHRNLVQKDFEKLGMKQSLISRLENPNYTGFSLATLKKIASIFDIGLIVRFVPISKLVEWELNLNNESLKILSYEEDPYFKERHDEESIFINSTVGEAKQCLGDTGIVDLNEYRKRISKSELSKQAKDKLKQKYKYSHKLTGATS